MLTGLGTDSLSFTQYDLCLPGLGTVLPSFNHPSLKLHVLGSVYAKFLQYSKCLQGLRTVLLSFNHYS